MKKLAQILFLSFILLNLLIAQNVDGNRVKKSIRDLARKIEQIRSLAERYQNDRALTVVIQAEEDLAQAVALLKEWEDDRRRINKLKMARIKYQAANKKADFASRLVLFKPIANLKNELERLLQQAENAASQIDNNDLIYYLTKAREFHRKAIQAFEQNRYLQGYEYVRIATYFAQKTISFAKSDKSGNLNREAFNEQRVNIQNLLNQATLLAENNSTLLDLYENARDYLEQSIKAYDQGKYKRAAGLLQLTERLLYRLIDMADDNSGESKQKRIEKNYQSLGRYLNAVRNEHIQKNSESRLLTKAEDLYEKAGRLMQQGQMEKAMTNINLSQNMAMRAFKKLSASPAELIGNLRARIDEVERLIIFQNNRLSNANNSALLSLHQQAVTIYKSAQQELNQNNKERAGYLLAISLRLFNRIEKLIESPQNQNMDKQQIQNDLSRLENIFDRLKTNPDIQENNLKKIAILEDILEAAKNAFSQNSWLSAGQLIELIRQQLTSLTAN